MASRPFYIYTSSLFILFIHSVSSMHKMARVDSSTVPPRTLAPTPTPKSVHSPRVSLVVDLTHLFLALNVQTTIVLLLLLFFLGRMRRSVRGRCIKNGTKICYLLVPIYITYIMGWLHKAPDLHVLSPVWASALIYAYGGVITITACDLRDNDETLSYVWHILPLFFWTIWLGVLVCGEIIHKYVPVLVCTHVFFLVSAMINTSQTLEAFYRASKSKGLPHLAEPIVHYMNEFGRGDDMVDPRSMRGYEYVVWGNPTSLQEKSTTIGRPRKKNITTIDEIWRWVFTPKEEETWESTSLGRKNKFLVTCVGKDQLRDMCLSYALFRVLLTRFAGFPAIRNLNCIRQNQFIQEGLLSMELEHTERAFHLIEVELDFLFDFFYTKAHVCGSYRFRDSWQHLVQILLLVFFASFGIPFLVKARSPHNYAELVDGNKAVLYDTEDELVKMNTMVAIFIFALLESFKYIMVQYSNRKIVWLLCTSIREADSNDMWASTTELRTALIWNIKHFLINKCHLVFFYFFKPWQRKLGQYSFLESYGRVPIFARKLFSPFGRVIKLPRDGQCGDSVVSLSKEVKQAIISSLVQYHELKLSRGTDALKRYGLDEILDTYRSLENNAHFILVWHIATGFCESNHPMQSKTDLDHAHFLVATQLSKYCAYLLAFSPELLPDHPYTTERAFDKAVKQARDFKEKGLDMHDLYKKLISRVDINKTIVVRGALLAHELAEYVIKRPNRGWKVLAEFWAEVLLYLAPSDDVGVHGEYLARGGEFITHLWALLTHAGVYTRESSSCMCTLNHAFKCEKRIDSYACRSMHVHSQSRIK